MQKSIAPLTVVVPLMLASGLLVAPAPTAAQSPPDITDWGTGAVQPIAYDAGRPWGWAVRAYMDEPDRPLYNTAKARLLAGEQIFSHSVASFDIEGYCETAPTYDFTWFEMQHSTLTFAEVEQMIAACPRSGTPIIRIPEATEAQVQQAMDIGALGVIAPTVDDFVEARAASRWVRFPPRDRRSAGGGQAGRIWTPASRELGTGGFQGSINDNMLVIVMIETLEGVANAYEIAVQPGVDVVMLGNADLSNFSGFAQDSPEYRDLQIRIRNATYLAGKFWGNATSAAAQGNPLAADSRFHYLGSPND